MGLFSMFGSAAKGYQSKFTKEYEDKARGATYNRMGSNPGHQVGMSEATSPYDFSGYDKGKGYAEQAAKGYQDPAKFTAEYSSGYKPEANEAFQFNYGKLPSAYANQAYEAGSSDVRRESQGNLEKLRESVGTRRPGLLMKAGLQSGRNTADVLSKLNAQIRLEEMNKNLEYGARQQQDQAGENARAFAANDAMQQYLSQEKFREYGSKADLEGRNAAERQANLQGLSSTGQLFGNMAQSEIGQRAGITDSERNYQDRAMEYLMNLYGQGSQQSQFNAGQENQSRQALRSAFLGGK